MPVYFDYELNPEIILVSLLNIGSEPGLRVRQRARATMRATRRRPAGARQQTICIETIT